MWEIRMTLLDRVQQITQQTKGALDGLAVAGGFAVWGEYVPVWVGIFTICWLGYQMILHLPKLLDSVAELKKRFSKKD
jgi:hypothetical protein